MFKDEIEMRVNTIPSAVVSASASTVGGVPVCREDEAATADVVVVKLKQPLSPAETDSIFFFFAFIQFELNWIWKYLLKENLDFHKNDQTFKFDLSKSSSCL